MEDLGVESRKILERKLENMNTSVFQVEALSILLVANFLREISDTLESINEKLQILDPRFLP